MLNLSKDIRSLSAFKRNSLEFLERLRESGSPLVLTVNGKAELVLQHVDTYQQLLERAERVDNKKVAVRSRTHASPRKPSSS